MNRIKMNRVRIDIDLIAQRHELGETFDLPDTPAIREALSTLQIACQNEVNRRERYYLEEFIGSKFGELQAAIRENACSNTKRQIMLSIVNYKRQVPFDL